jgi:hypothetical protein
MVVRPSEWGHSAGNTKNFLVTVNFCRRCRVRRFIATVGHNLGQIGVCEIVLRRYRSKKEIPL